MKWQKRQFFPWISLEPSYQSLLTQFQRCLLYVTSVQPIIHMPTARTHPEKCAVSVDNIDILCTILCEHPKAAHGKSRVSEFFMSKHGPAGSNPVSGKSFRIFLYGIAPAASSYVLPVRRAIGLPSVSFTLFALSANTWAPRLRPIIWTVPGSVIPILVGSAMNSATSVATFFNKQHTKRA